MVKKKALNQPKRWFVHILFALLIIIATSITWHGILNQVIEGEGYYYFSPTNSFLVPPGKIAVNLEHYDNFPRLITYTLEQFYQGDIQPYMTFQFLVIILVNLTVYLVLYGTTKNKVLALLGALYFGLNYSGNYQIYARGHFQWFCQRVFEFFPLLGSMYFLYRFYLLKSVKNYLLSYLLFLLAVLMTHYTILFLPYFPGFLIGTAWLYRTKTWPRLRLALLSIPFIITTYLIVGNSSLGLDIIHPHQTLLESLWIATENWYKILFQLVVVTIPYSALDLLFHFIKLPKQILINWLIVPVAAFYPIAGYYLYKKRLPYFNLIFGAFIGLIGALFMTVFVNRVVVVNEIEQGRYLFVPGFFVGILFATLISNTIKKPNLTSKLLLTLLILLWAVPNTYFTWDKMNASQRYYTGGRAILTYLNQVKSHLPPDSIVILPNPIMPLGIDFLKKYYNPGTTRFLFNDTKWMTKVSPLDVDKLYVFDYNDEYYRGPKARIEYISVVDKSLEYRKALLSK